MVQLDEKLQEAVTLGDVPAIHETVDAIKAKQREIGRAIAKQLGEHTTIQAFRDEMRARRFSITHGEEVRNAFDAYRAVHDWTKLE